MLKRKIDNYFRNYYETTRNALLVTGARQTGKTYSIRHFGKTFKSFVEINFIEMPKAVELFKGAKNSRDTTFLIIRRKDNAFSAFCAKDGPLPCDLQSPSSSLPLPYFLPTFFLYIHKDEVGRRWRPSKRKKELCRGKSEAFPGKKSLEKAGNEEKSAFSRHFFCEMFGQFKNSLYLCTRKTKTRGLTERKRSM